MTDAEEEFLKAMAACIPVIAEPLEYRIYYNENGDIIRCSMQAHEDGCYLVVSQEEYNNYAKYTVVGGKLKRIEHDAGHRALLVKSAHGFRTVKNHANLILEGPESYSDIEYYEYRIN